jgi:hypothetical protein
MLDALAVATSKTPPRPAPAPSTCDGSWSVLARETLVVVRLDRLARRVSHLQSAIGNSRAKARTMPHPARHILLACVA